MHAHTNKRQRQQTQLQSVRVRNTDLCHVPIRTVIFDTFQRGFRTEARFRALYSGSLPARRAAARFTVAPPGPINIIFPVRISTTFDKRKRPEPRNGSDTNCPTSTTPEPKQQLHIKSHRAGTAYRRPAAGLLLKTSSEQWARRYFKLIVLTANTTPI